MWWTKKEEVRSIEDPKVPISSAAMIDFLGGGAISSAGIDVNTDNALGVPAVWAAVQFLSSTIASLPLNVYEKTKDGRKKQDKGLALVLNRAPNDETSSFEWRKYSMERVLTGGRAISYIESDKNGKIINIWPINPKNIIVLRKNGRKSYEFKDGSAPKITYKSSEIMDIPFSLKADGLASISPIDKCKDAIGLAIAATNYGGWFFKNGAVPLAVMEGPFESKSAIKRATDDLQSAVKSAYAAGRKLLALPVGHKITTVGIDPDKSQLEQLKRFSIEEVARIYSLPPVFIQDLTHGTFSNTEQQDLQLVKHTVRRWVTQIEQELNLKLFGRENTKMYVEFNLDALLRGDFTSRMSGYATGIQNGMLKPNEARSMENRDKAEGGDDLFIQGATVPLKNQINAAPEGGQDD